MMNVTFKERDVKVCAVITYFNPDEGFPDRVTMILSEVQPVIIVNDSGSLESKEKLSRWFDLLYPRILLLHHKRNKGVAAALNTGLGYAAAMGFDYAVLFDDDSIIVPGMIGTLLTDYHTHAQDTPAILGVSFVNSWKGLKQRGVKEIKKAKYLITAGSLIPLKVYRLLGPFREELFIDYVDIEYCLRARTRGIRILQSTKIGMVQPIGQRQGTFFGEIRSIHSPTRTYYLFRNSFALVREYFRDFPGFLIWVGWQQLKTLAKIMIFMRRKRLYLKAILRGLADAWACRFGRMPDDIVL